MLRKVDECESTIGGRALCNIHDAFLTVYLLFLGTPLLDTRDSGEDLTIGTITLIATFAVVLVMFFIYLIIWLVHNTPSKVGIAVAVTDFWECKLALVYLVADVEASFSSCFSSSPVLWDGSKTRNSTCNTNLTDTFASLWDACTMSAFPRTRTRSC